MSGYSKYSLRNANDLLNRLRKKYNKGEHEQSQCQHSKTFIQEESLQLYEEPNSQLKQNQDRSNKKQNVNVDNLSKIYEQKQEENTFCDKLIIKNLEETLKLYEQDLDVLCENRSYLQEKIEFLSQKIHKLNQIQYNNKTLTDKNQKLKEYLADLINQYHQSMKSVFKSRLIQQEAFNSLRQKVRMVLKDAGEDYFYIGFVQHWNQHIEQSHNIRKIIKTKINEDFKKEELKKKEQPRKVEKIFGNPQKQKTVKYENDEFSSFDEPKPKKKMSQAEKASLLGDLKSFAKNFKFSSG